MAGNQHVLSHAKISFRSREKEIVARPNISDVEHGYDWLQSKSEWKKTRNGRSAPSHTFHFDARDRYLAATG